MGVFWKNLQQLLEKLKLKVALVVLVELNVKLRIWGITTVPFSGFEI